MLRMGTDSRTWTRKRQVLPCRRIPKLHEATQLLATWALTAHPKVQLGMVTSCHRGQCNQDLSAPSQVSKASITGTSQGQSTSLDVMEWKGGVSSWVLLPNPQPSLTVRGKS